MGVGKSCIKYSLFFFNFLFWLFGLALIGISIYVLVDKNFHERFEDDVMVDLLDSIRSGAIVMIIVGAIIFILGFLGCCGAIRESQCMLGTFFGLLLVIFIALIAVGIWILVYGPTKTIQTAIKANLELIKKVGEGAEDVKVNDGKLWLNFIEQELKCCADQGVQDYLKLGTGYVSATCAKAMGVATEKKGVLKVVGTVKNVLEGKTSLQGCTEAFDTFFNKYKWWIGLVALIICLVILIGLIMAICLCCMVRKSDTMNV